MVLGVGSGLRGSVNEAFMTAICYCPGALMGSGIVAFGGHRKKFFLKFEKQYRT